MHSPLSLVLLGMAMTAVQAQDEPLTMPLPGNVPLPPAVPLQPIATDDAVDVSGTAVFESQPASVHPQSPAAYCPPQYMTGTMHYSGSRSFFRWPKYIKCPPMMPPPAGDSINAFWATQISNGDAARMVLYHYDFVPGHSRLTERGERQLAKIAVMLQQNPHPLIIQPSPRQSTLDALRREYVINELVLLDLPVSPERVIVMRPPARGLDGIDAEAIFLKQAGLSGGGGGGGTTGLQSTPSFPGQ